VVVVDPVSAVLTVVVVESVTSAVDTSPPGVDLEGVFGVSRPPSGLISNRNCKTILIKQLQKFHCIS